MADLLISALGSQAASLEERLIRLHGQIQFREHIPGAFYACGLRFKDGTVVNYGWRVETRDGKEFLVPFEERSPARRTREPNRRQS